VRLNHISLSGFRGAPIDVTLTFEGKSCFLYAENGFGKTTFVDALEYWSSGDVEAYHREGALLDSIINLDSDSATVSCAPLGDSEISRILLKRGISSGTPSPTNPALETLTLIPILRHRTMADFMAKTPGDKKDTLLQILGLEGLTSFKETLVTASNDANRIGKSAASQEHTEKSALKAMYTKTSLIETAESLRQKAGLSESITTESELELLSLTPTAILGSPNFNEMITELDRYRDLSEIATSITTWNESVEDETQSAAAVIDALLTAGQAAIPIWTDATCPLCEQTIDHGALTDHIEARRLELEDSVAARNSAQASLAAAAANVDKLSQALGNLVRHPPQNGWQEAGQMADTENHLTNLLTKIRSALADTEKCPELPRISIPISAALRKTVSDASSESQTIQAVMSLAALRDQYLRSLRAAEKSESSGSVANTIQEFLNATSDRIQAEIESALTELSDLVSTYYSLLRTSGLYTDIKLQYTTNRSGGIEFHVEYDSRHDVSPPHRVMSESQLNSLGLALFLARLKRGHQAWNLFVLDDVVNSFDADHRHGLAALLQSEFRDWQVLLMTHDRYFQSIAQDVLNDWTFVSIGAWTPSGGPVLTQGNSLDVLTARLLEGRAASELGGVARIALEEGLSRPLAKLEMPIRYDPLNRFAARELLDALRTSLKRAKSDSLRDLDVIKRMAAETYMSNLSAHYRPADPQPSREDLSRLANDLSELRDAFQCSSCNTNVWKLFDRSRHSWQCKCGGLEY